MATFWLLDSDRTKGRCPRGTWDACMNVCPCIGARHAALCGKEGVTRNHWPILQDFAVLSSEL
eukprot:9477776-Pyramimonas_sp.AAC.1